ncbi:MULTISPECIES: Rrf2 family transcriptional regulator [unclassified Gordonia (in: high G+C Gram-positive bacteria)]|uniref:RrF2 family transcriptional regulator n=1 Tax=unclassified Gordonia (in: high G+C Gram-positive bacteria) TaxID=2657482 RepID=UPI001F10A18A|nr:Rrf2 family transcriptional regulator [Gordonia sp. ABSL49_1]MCH5644164.1 Rrf2 family transcriptional regulator [Gordonia sp. ABSL49_1]
MQLTRFTDIGLRVVMRLAAADRADSKKHSDRRTLTTRDLATELSVPYTHVAKVVSRLSEMGVVHSRRGRSGGLMITELGRDARVGWLAETLEGPGEVVDCNSPEPCPLRGACRLRGALAQARTAFFRSLDDQVIADLVADPTGAVLLALRAPQVTPDHTAARARDHTAD